VAVLAPLRDVGGRSYLSQRTLRALHAIAEAMFSTDAGPPPAERLAWLLAEAEDFLARAGARTRFVVGLMVLVVSLAAPILSLRAPPLARLPLAERVRVLRRLEDSGLSGPLFAVKALLSILYYEHPDAAREVGFDGACLGSRS